eukprot:TRINITY_DN4254_c0_g3_i1.p1 TRINITY_DN4254_c0_g3~~TRINITY_DN4254_c0_g3_i1.p1  ORF type:complete len:166 (-),score=11.79 TRINITY_DN4254_c0_g3_i1:108-605(-)
MIVQMRGDEHDSRSHPEVTHQDTVCLKKLANRSYNTNLIGSIFNYEKVVGHDMRQLYKIYEETIGILSIIFIEFFINEALMNNREAANGGKKELNRKANKQLLHRIDEFPDRPFLNVEKAKCSKKYKNKYSLRSNERSMRNMREAVNSMERTRKIFKIVTDNDKM